MARVPPSAPLPTPRRAAARALSAVVRGVGVILLVCGALLVLIAALVQASRQRRMALEAHGRTAPRFEDTIRPASTLSVTGMVAPAASSATPTAPAGAKHVADRRAGRTPVPRVIVFGSAGDAALAGDAAGAGDAARSAPRRVPSSGSPGGRVSTAPPSDAPSDAPATATPLPPPDRIVIAKIGVDRPVVPIGWTQTVVDNETLRSVWKTADDAAGWHETSARPGQVGNTVISGHNNIAGAVFKDLNALAAGDTVTLHAGRAEVRYTIERTFIVREEGATDEERLANNRWIEPTADDRLTLVTCYPPWSNTHRLIVIARPVVFSVP